MNKKKILIGGIVAIAFSFLCISGRASAATIENKALAYDIWRCYHNNTAIITETKEAFFDEIEINDVMRPGLTLPATNIFGTRGNVKTIDCQSLLVGKVEAEGRRTFNGLLGNKADDGLSRSEMEELGYALMPSGNCIWFNFDAVDDSNHGSTSTVKSEKLCLPTGANMSRLVVNGKDALAMSALNFSIINDEANNRQLQITGAVIGNKDRILVDLKNYTDLEKLRYDIGSMLGKGYQDSDSKVSGTTSYSVSRTQPSSSGEYGRYVLNGSIENAALNAVNNTLGESFSAASDFVPFSADEAYVLYHRYLDNYYRVERVCNVSASDEGIYKSNPQWVAGPMLNEGEIGTCYFRATDNQEQTVNALNGLLQYDGSQKGWRDLLLQLEGVRDQLTVEGILGAERSNSASSGETSVDCGNSGGAGALGWIVCPVMEWMVNTSKSLYEDTVKDQLSIDPRLFSGSGFDGTKEAWGMFQGIANTLFIILFLIVIISQLTGIGIDNYGIKKILPKIILSAILINISYYLCLVAIDLSNIIGNGIQALFDGMAEGLSPALNVEGSGFVDSFNSTGFSAVAILGLMFAGGLAIWTNPAIILTLLVSAIGVVVAILFLFLLLAAREAVVVVLTIISPLAFACLMLPNTKNLFSRWLKMSEGLLLVYPICGLLVGGGNYLSKLLLSVGIADGGFFSAFAALAIGIAPIFFIPMVLRGAFTSMGNIGARISSIGTAIGRGTQRAARNSTAYKTAQELGAQRRTRINAGVDKNGKAMELGTFGTLIRGGRRNVQRNKIRYNRDVAERGSLEATEGSEFMLDTQTANETKSIIASGESNYINEMKGSLSAALESDDKAKIRAYTDILTSKGENGRDAVKAAYNYSSGRMSNSAAMTFANNILNKHGADYKNYNRSLFDIAKNINAAGRDEDKITAARMSTGDYLNNSNGKGNIINKLTSQSLSSMDDAAFKELFMRGGNLQFPEGQGVNEELVGKTIYDSLRNQGASMKASRRADLERLLAQSGYVPPVSIDNGGSTANATGGSRSSGDGLDIPHFVNGSNSSSGEAEIAGFMKKK